MSIYKNEGKTILDFVLFMTNGHLLFQSVKISKFFIVLAMAAIGFNTDIVKLVKTGGKPLAMGACCWIGITAVSLVVMHFTGTM